MTNDTDTLRPPRPTRSPTIADYEDFSKLALTPAEIDTLVGAGGQCVFSWTTRDGYPAGVVMAYVYCEGKFWLNCAEHRKRVTALQARPQSAVVISDGEKMASFKGRSLIHCQADPDWDALKTWFYSALAGTDREPDNAAARSFERFLDGPHQVIIETAPMLVVSFDFGKFVATARAAIAGR